LVAVYTQAGEEFLVDILDGTLTIVLDGTARPFVAMGTGAVAPAKGDTALGAETPEARGLAADSQPAADKNQWVGTITATAARAITEAGLLTESAVGVLIMRDTFTVINLATNDKLEITASLEQT